MPNDSKTLFEAMKRKGLADREALFAVIDHFNQQHFYDRNSQHAKIKELENKVARLEGQSV